MWAAASDCRLAGPPSVSEAAIHLRTAVLSRRPTLLLESAGGVESLPPPSVADQAPRVLRKGSRATLLCWGSAVSSCLAVAEEVDELEVVQLRWFEPLMLTPLSSSLRKTGRLLLVDGGAVQTGDAVLSRIATACFDLLDRPPQRVGLEPRGLRPLDDASIAAAAQQLTSEKAP